MKSQRMSIDGGIYGNSQSTVWSYSRKIRGGRIFAYGEEQKDRSSDFRFGSRLNM